MSLKHNFWGKKEVEGKREKKKKKDFCFVEHFMSGITSAAFLPFMSAFYFTWEKNKG